jgi:hypothetical protein
MHTLSCYYFWVFWRRSSAGQSMRLISAESGVQVPASLPDITMPPFIGGFVFLGVTKGVLVQIPGTKWWPHGLHFQRWPKME